jgi:WD40 repeat protein
MWDLGAGEALGEPLAGHIDAVTSVAVTPDGTRIVSGSFDRTIRVWDRVTGTSVGDPLTGHTGRVTTVVITPDGMRIVSGSDDNTVRVWALGTGECLLEVACSESLEPSPSAPPEAMGWSSPGTRRAPYRRGHSRRLHEP